MTTEQTGNSKGQTYNTRDYTGLWQVLYNDEEHGLQIVSADVVTNGIGLCIRQKKGYNNLVNTLNSFCSNYVNSIYATSGRCVGSNPIKPEGTTEFYEGSYDYVKQYANDLIKGDTDYITDFNAMEGATHQNINGIIDIGKNYWLASRDVFGDSSQMTFNVNILYSDRVSRCNVCYATKSGFFCTVYPTFEVRVVIVLKSGIKAINGNGSIENPYELV